MKAKPTNNEPSRWYWCARFNRRVTTELCAAYQSIGGRMYAKCRKCQKWKEEADLKSSGEGHGPD